MKTRLILYIMALSVLAACSDLETGSTRHTATQIAVTPPVGISGMQINSQQIKITNLTTGVTTTLSSTEGITLAEGLYDMVYSADITYTAHNANDETAQAKGRLNGKAENVQITGSSRQVQIETFLSADNDDFIIEEIFFAGTLRSSGLQ